MVFSQPDIIVGHEKRHEEGTKEPEPGGVHRRSPLKTGRARRENQKIKRARKKAQTLQSGPVNPPLEEVEETTGATNTL